MINSRTFWGIAESSERYRDRVSYIIDELSDRQNRLDITFKKLQKYEKNLFDKCVSSIIENNQDVANIYANECVKIKNEIKKIFRNQLVLARVLLKLEIIRDYKIR